MEKVKKKNGPPVVYDKDGNPIKFKMKESIKKSDLIFYIILMAFPIIHFCIFYIGVNFNSFLLSFQDITWNTETNSYLYSWNANNMITSLVDLVTDASNVSYILNGIWFYLIGLVLSTPLSLIFSYYIYKRCIGYNIFRIFLFLPSIIAAMSLLMIFQYFFDQAIFGEFGIVSELYGFWIKDGIFGTKATRFIMLIVYNIFFGFGGGVLIYSDSMGAISPEVVESASLDGATGLREFWHITFPLIFGMWSIFFITGIAGIFTGQYNLYSIYRGQLPEDVSTLGYYMFVQTEAGEDNYPKMSAWGLWLSFITIPVTFLVKWLLEKYGPSTD